MLIHEKKMPCPFNNPECYVCYHQHGSGKLYPQCCYSYIQDNRLLEHTVVIALRSELEEEYIQFAYFVFCIQFVGNVSTRSNKNLFSCHFHWNTEFMSMNIIRQRFSLHQPCRRLAWFNSLCLIPARDTCINMIPPKRKEYCVLAWRWIERLGWPYWLANGDTTGHCFCGGEWWTKNRIGCLYYFVWWVNGCPT